MPLLRAKELTDIIDKAQIIARAVRRAARGRARRRARRLSDAAARRSLRRRTRPTVARDACAPQAGHVRQRRHRRRRHGADRVHVGHDRQAEGHDALPSRRARRLRLLAAPLLRATADDVFTGSPPLAFTFGLGGLLLFPLRIGAATLLLEKAPRRTRCCPRSPRIARRCCSRRRRRTARWRRMAHEFDLSSLRKCVSAGEALPAATRKLWKDATGIEIIDGIGATEMLHIFISHDEAHARPGATGKPVPGYRACVMDDGGHPLPPGTGRPARGARDRPVAATSPTSASATTCSDGWNYTGDAYLVDDDGYFVYQARTDDMIISAGYNIAGPEVEGALLAASGRRRMRRGRRARRRARADRQGVRRAEARPRRRRRDRRRRCRSS